MENTVIKVAEVIKQENLHIGKLAERIGIGRETLERVIHGKRKAGKAVTEKLEMFLQQYDSGNFDTAGLIKPKKPVKPVHKLKENERYIAGTDNKYTIDTEGNVFSIRSNKYLKPFENAGGYLKVEINGKQVYVHRLVGQAFIPNPDNLPEINHIDFNTRNNRLENLEWVTSEQNVRHSLLHGRMSGRGCVQIDKESGKVIAKYDTLREASRAVGVDAGSISKVCKGKMKTAGKFRWEYKIIFTCKDKTNVKEHPIFTNSVVLWAK